MVIFLMRYLLRFDGLPALLGKFFALNIHSIRTIAYVSCSYRLITPILHTCHVSPHLRIFLVAHRYFLSFQLFAAPKTKDYFYHALPHVFQCFCNHY